jgi:hypothetical protein
MLEGRSGPESYDENHTPNQPKPGLRSAYKKTAT